MSWKMQMCLSGDKPLTEKTFESLEDGIDWLRQNHPGMLDPHRFRIQRDGFRQFGEGYYWTTLERQT